MIQNAVYLLVVIPFVLGFITYDVSKLLKQPRSNPAEPTK